MLVPAWAIAVVGTFVTCLLGVLGFLLRHVLNSIQKQGEASQRSIESQTAALGRMREDFDRRFAVVDKRFVEEQLAQTGKFVDRESWTRDYVTLTSRIDGLHKRTDRVERDLLTTGRRSPRSSSSPGFEPPKT